MTMLLEEHAYETFESKYAVLSHPWEDDEVTLRDFGAPGFLTKADYRKIAYTCERARRDGISYVWVDAWWVSKRAISYSSLASMAAA